jgi:hypothetical protein
MLSDPRLLSPPPVAITQPHRAWLIIWTLNNIGVTLLNKAAFQTVNFHYPYFLSAVHMVCNSVGSQLVFWSVDRAKASGDPGAVEANPVTKLLGVINRQHLDAKGKRLILAFSVIFSLNIAIGNVSLKYVSVNFNQVRYCCWSCCCGGGGGGARAACLLACCAA